MTEPIEVVGETPFTAEERYRLRLIDKAFKDLSLKEMQELANLAHTGKAARLVLVIVGRATVWIGAALTAIVSYRAWVGK